MMESEIVNLQKMLKDPKQMEAIASKIVRLAIQNAAEQKKGLEIKNPMAAQVVKAGEIIPPNLSEKAKAGVGGLAAESWEKTWTDAIVWSRSWEKTGSKVGLVAASRPAVISRVKTPTSTFTAEELKVLKDLNINIS
jgi:hypothetical protein